MHRDLRPPTRNGFALWGVLLATQLAVASQNGADSQQQAFEPADTSSPRATLRSFIESCNEFHRRIQSEHTFDRSSAIHHPLAMRILDCLDASQLPEYERLEAAGEAAVFLKEILDRFPLPPYEEVPDTAAIHAAGGDQLSQWRIPGTRITIARVEEGPQRLEYLFSPGTVGRAVDYYRDVQSLPYRREGPAVSPGLADWYLTAPGHPVVARIVEWLPAWWRGQTLGMPRWKWGGLLLTAVLALLLMGLAYRLHRQLSARYRDKNLFRYCLTIVFPVIGVLIALGFVYVARNHLTLRGTPLYVVGFAAHAAALVASLVVVFSASNRIVAVILASPRINPRGLDAQFIRIVSKLLSVTLAVIVLLEGGHYLGIPITTLIASAGVGGLALALAAQDTLKNLFGTIMLLTDKPFRVGERIVFGKYDGMVQAIGLRSTRIRLLTGHEATIPNEMLARTDIENVGRRPYIRRVADIQIPLDTPREKLEQAVAIIRTALENHAGMDPEYPPRVYFFDFQATAFVVRVIYWYSPPNYWDYLAEGEKINFAIFRAFEEQGIKFSLPVRVATSSLEGDEQPLEVKLTEPPAASDP